MYNYIMNYSNNVGSGYDDQRYINTNRCNWNNSEVPTPILSNKFDFDNPLLPKSGVPLTEDDFVDSTDRIINASNTNDIRYDATDNIWNVDPSVTYDGNNLAGIDTTNKDNGFDLGKFNIVFDRTKDVAKENQRINDLNRLNSLAEEKTPNNVYDLSLFQIIVNTKDAWFGLLDDLLEQRFELNTFTRDNRLFYIGVTILFFAVILYIYTIIVADKPKEENVQKIYHIYQYPQYPANSAYQINPRMKL